MGTHDLPDMYAHVTTVKYNYTLTVLLGLFTQSCLLYSGKLWWEKNWQFRQIEHQFVKDFPTKFIMKISVLFCASI